MDKVVRNLYIVIWVVAMLVTSTPATTGVPQDGISAQDGAKAQPSLRDLAKRRRLYVGSAMPVGNLKNNIDGGRYADTAAKTFSLLELENDLKPPAIWTGPHEYHFSDVDFVVGEPGK